MNQDNNNSNNNNQKHEGVEAQGVVEDHKVDLALDRTSRPNESQPGNLDYTLVATQLDGPKVRKEDHH